MNRAWLIALGALVAAGLAYLWIASRGDDAGPAAVDRPGPAAVEPGGDAVAQTSQRRPREPRVPGDTPPAPRTEPPAPEGPGPDDVIPEDPRATFEERDGVPPPARELVRIGETAIGVDRDRVLENEAEIAEVMRRFAEKIEAIDAEPNPDPVLNDAPYSLLLNDLAEALTPYMYGTFYIATRYAVIETDIPDPATWQPEEDH